MKKKPEITKIETAAKSKLFEVQSVSLKFSNGVSAEWERLTTSTSGAVLVVPVNEHGNMLLIREFAAGTERYELAFPKGKMEAGEDPIVSANREIREEIGFGARRIELLKTVSLAPGYFSHTTHLLIAQDLYSAPLPGDEPEPLDVVEWSFDDIEHLLQQPDFSEGRSIAALFLAHRYLHSGN